MPPVIPRLHCALHNLTFTTASAAHDHEGAADHTLAAVPHLLNDEALWLVDLEDSVFWFQCISHEAARFNTFTDSYNHSVQSHLLAGVLPGLLTAGRALWTFVTE